MKKQLGPSDAIFPVPAALIVSGIKDEANIITLFKEVDYCGLTTGRKRNKFKDTGLTPVKAKRIRVPIIKECPYNLVAEFPRKSLLEITFIFWERLLNLILMGIRRMKPNGPALTFQKSILWFIVQKLVSIGR
jgi:hypothetical protein